MDNRTAKDACGEGVMSGLTERLRAQKQHTYRQQTKLDLDAADRIEELTRELNDAEAIHKEQWCKIDTLTATVEELTSDRHILKQGMEDVEDSRDHYDALMTANDVLAAVTFRRQK